jgi:hypothetical protein
MEGRTIQTASKIGQSQIELFFSYSLKLCPSNLLLPCINNREKKIHIMSQRHTICFFIGKTMSQKTASFSTSPTPPHYVDWRVVTTSSPRPSMVQSCLYFFSMVNMKE